MKILYLAIYFLVAGLLAGLPAIYLESRTKNNFVVYGSSLLTAVGIIITTVILAHNCTSA